MMGRPVEGANTKGTGQVK